SVNDFLPSLLSATAASGNGWTCTIFGPQQVNCTQPAGTVAPGGSYPPITLAVNVSSTSGPITVTNLASVTGIGDANPANNSVFDFTQIVPPISIAPTSPTTVTVSAGTAATFNFTVTLSTNPPAGTVNFSNSPVPLFSKASYNSTSITQSGTVTFTVDTSGGGHVAALHPSGFVRWTTVYAAVFFALFGMFGMKRSKRTSSKRWLLTGAGISGLALALAFVGCGGHSGPPLLPVFTPPGTYTITVTATSSNSSIPPAVVPVTVIVK